MGSSKKVLLDQAVTLASQKIKGKVSHLEGRKYQIGRTPLVVRYATKDDRTDTYWCGLYDDDMPHLEGTGYYLLTAVDDKAALLIKAKQLMKRLNLMSRSSNHFNIKLKRLGKQWFVTFSDLLIHVDPKHVINLGRRRQYDGESEKCG